MYFGMVFYLLIVAFSFAAAVALEKASADEYTGFTYEEPVGPLAPNSKLATRIEFEINAGKKTKDLSLQKKAEVFDDVMRGMRVEQQDEGPRNCAYAAKLMAMKLLNIIEKTVTMKQASDAAGVPDDGDGSVPDRFKADGKTPNRVTYIEEAYYEFSTNSKGDSSGRANMSSHERLINAKDPTGKRIGTGKKGNFKWSEIKATKPDELRMKLKKELLQGRIVAARHPFHTTSLYYNPFNDKVIEICSIENRLTTQEDRSREYTPVPRDKYYVLKEK